MPALFLPAFRPTECLGTSLQSRMPCTARFLSSSKVCRAQGHLFAHGLEQGGVGVGVGLHGVAPGLAVLHAVYGGQGAPPLLRVAHGRDEGRVGAYVGLHPCTAEEGLDQGLVSLADGRDGGCAGLHVGLHSCTAKGIPPPPLRYTACSGQDFLPCSIYAIVQVAVCVGYLNAGNRRSTSLRLPNFRIC